MKRATSKDRRKLLLRSSIPNLVAILLSLSLLLGATLAIASYIVTSPNNTIRTGTFDVTFSLLNDNATDLSAEQSWSPIENDTAIFTCSNWQQTSTVVEVIRVKNDGTVAIQWKVAVVPVNAQAAAETGDTPDLADVIDVYFKAVSEVPEMTTNGETGVTTCNLDEWESAGTLRDLLNGKDWASHIVAGQDTAYVAIALQMQAGASADYLGLDASFTLKFLAVQAVASDDQWPDVNADDSSVAPADPNEPDTTAAATVTPETTSAEPETTSAEPDPQPTTPSEPSDPNVYKASEEGLPANTPIENTRLGQTFGVIYNGEGSGKLTDADTYQLTNGELRTATNEPYAFTIVPSEYTTFNLYARSHLANSLENGGWAGDGIKLTITDNGKMKIAITHYEVTEQDASEGTGIKAGAQTIDINTNDTITIADSGDGIYILVEDVLRAVIQLDGTYKNSEVVVPVGENTQFVQTAVLYTIDDNIIPEEVLWTRKSNTTIASTCNAQCGIVTDATVSFSEISLRPYEDVASLIADQLAQLENSGDIE